jgi:glutamate carboxypeptidase
MPIERRAGEQTTGTRGDLLQFCRAERDWLLNTVEALVSVESPTLDKAAVDRCGVELANRLEEFGGTVTRLPGGDRADHLRVEFSSSGAAIDTRPILLLGHFDTVWPIGQLERMPLRRENGRLYGPGVFDMKAGIGIAMLATRALLETGTLGFRIVMLWTTDEEIGSSTSRAAIETEARRSAAVLVLEPSLPGGAVKTARKGCGQYELHVHGIAAHAGIDPTQGASAIVELAHQICHIAERLPRLSPGISVNVGTVAGGSRPNVVADEAHAVIDVRAAAASEMALADGTLRELQPWNPRTRLVWSGGFDRPPLERTGAVVRLYEGARQVAADLGIELAEGSTGGGSDGNFTAALGVPTLDGLGAVGDGAHALHEHVLIDALPDRAALVAGLIRSIAED